MIRHIKEMYSVLDVTLLCSYLLCAVQYSMRGIFSSWICDVFFFHSSFTLIHASNICYQHAHFPSEKCPLWFFFYLHCACLWCMYYVLYVCICFEIWLCNMYVHIYIHFVDISRTQNSATTNTATCCIQSVIQCIHRSIIFVDFFERRTLQRTSQPASERASKWVRTSEQQHNNAVLEPSQFTAWFSHQLQIVSESNFLEHSIQAKICTSKKY